MNIQLILAFENDLENSLIGDFRTPCITKYCCLGQGHGYSSGDWDSPSPILNTEPPAALPGITNFLIISKICLIVSL